MVMTVMTIAELRRPVGASAVQLPELTWADRAISVFAMIHPMAVLPKNEICRKARPRNLANARLFYATIGNGLVAPKMFANG